MFKQTANLIADALIYLDFLDIEYREFPAFCTVEVGYNGEHLGRVKVEEMSVSFIADGMEMSEELWNVWQIAVRKVGDTLVEIGEDYEQGRDNECLDQQPQSQAPRAGGILPDTLEIGGKFGTCRDLSIDDVKAIVARFYKFKAKGGKLPDFYEQLTIVPGTPRSFEIDTLRGWVKAPRFKPPEN